MYTATFSCILISFFDDSSTLFSFKVKFHLCECLHLPSIPKVTTKPSVGYLMFFYSFTYCIKFFFRFCRFVLLVGFNLLLPVSVICLRLLHRSTKTPFQIVFSISTLEWSVWFFVLLSVFFFFFSSISFFFCCPGCVSNVMWSWSWRENMLHR